MNRGAFIIILFLAAILLQISFLPVLVPAASLADAAIMAVIAVVILLGFERNIAWIASAGLMYDLLAHWRLGRNVLVLVLVGYVTSFFVRRFRVGGRGLGLFIMLLLVAASLLLGFFVDLSLEFIYGPGTNYFGFPPLASFFYSLALDLLVLGVGFWFVKRVVKYLAPENIQLKIK